MQHALTRMGAFIEKAVFLLYSHDFLCVVSGFKLDFQFKPIKRAG